MSNPTLAVQRVYLKDASLELPSAPAIFLSGTPLQVDINLDISHQKLANDLFEVVERVTLTARNPEQTAYLLEIKQAVIVQVSGVAAEEQLLNILNTQAPYIAHPYARANIADLLIRAGFAPFHLPDIAFEQIAEQAAPTVH